MTNISKLELLTRLGFAARGIIYGVIGYLAFRLGRAEDPKGALEYLAGGAGSVLLGIMSAGLLAYGIWRLAEAVIDTEGKGTDPKGSVVRAGGAISGIIHLAFAFYATKLALGLRLSKESSDTAEAGSATALSLPGGYLLLIAAAAVLLVTGAAQFFKAYKGSFLRHMDASVSKRPWILWTGCLGYASRGVIFLVTALFFWRAAKTERASDAGGIQDVLTWLPSTVQTLVALGLVLFGIFSLLEARYRRINDPQVVERLKNKVRDVRG